MYAVVIVTLLAGCATSGGAMKETRSFSLSNGSKIAFDKSGCVPKNVKFINSSDKSARLSGTVIASNSNQNETVDEFMLSCSPAVAGGSSSCSLLKIRGSGGFYEYGGLGCPDMKFTIMNVHAF
jgi:hypothetical protein